MPADHHRLSLTKCRKLLPSSTATLSDAEVLQLRDELYDLANLVADAHQAIVETAGNLDYSKIQMSDEELIAFGDRHGFEFRNWGEDEEPQDLGYQA